MLCARAFPRPKETQEVDRYRNRVIAAEQEVRWTGTAGVDVTRLRQRVLKSAWWTKQCKPTSPLGYLKTTKGEFSIPCANYHDVGALLYGGNGHGGSPELRLMHALAHHMTDYTIEGTGPHGPEFARNYLTAAKRWLGQEAKDQLAVAFATHRVKTRTWSPEARAAAKRRIALKELRELSEELG